MANQAQHIARNVPREVAQLSPSGLVTYLADRIGDLGWSVTQHAQRQVFTLEALAPRGQRIIVDV